MTNTQSRGNDHLNIIKIAFPLILANITVPLLGLVDTAILGHMQHTYYLAGASIGSLIITQLIWVCGFIKMSVTGLSAQSKHADAQVKLKVLTQACYLGAIIGLTLCLLQWPILKAGLWFAQTASEVQQSTTDYFMVRIWSAPASLINLALIGWFIGQQQTSLVLVLQVVVNLLNILFSLLFVYGFDWGIQGVALGTVLADYSLLLMSLMFAFKPFKQVDWLRSWFSVASLKVLLNLNSNILLRNLALQITLAFVTFKGAQLGQTTAATNAILMQFFALIALGLDGIANAVEALVGEAKGKQRIDQINKQVTIGLLWSSIFAIAYSLLFTVFGQNIINLLTDQSELRQSTYAYLWLVVCLPVVSHWCFLFDGVFVGLTKGAAMKNSMLISAALGFFPIWWVFQDLGNVALWYAMLGFLAVRGLTLGIWYYLQLNTRSAALLD